MGRFERCDSLTAGPARATLTWFLPLSQTLKQLEGLIADSWSSAHSYRVHMQSPISSSLTSPIKQRWASLLSRPPTCSCIGGMMSVWASWRPFGLPPVYVFVLKMRVDGAEMQLTGVYELLINSCESTWKLQNIFNTLLSKI